MAQTPPLIVRAELPTPDLVLVRGEDGELVLFVDDRLPQDVVDDALADLDSIQTGPAHDLSAVG